MYCGKLSLPKISEITSFDQVVHETIVFMTLGKTTCRQRHAVMVLPYIAQIHATSANSHHSYINFSAYGPDSNMWSTYCTIKLSCMQMKLLCNR